MTGTVNGGTLEVGYQIGCGIRMDYGMRLSGAIGVTAGPSFNPAAATPIGLGNVNFPIIGGVEVFPRPGEVIDVAVDVKVFNGTQARVTVKDIHMKVDGCVGASSLRSYAVLTSSGTDTDDIVAYYGVTKVF